MEKQRTLEEIDAELDALREERERVLARPAGFDWAADRNGPCLRDAEGQECLGWAAGRYLATDGLATDERITLACLEELCRRTRKWREGRGK